MGEQWTARRSVKNGCTGEFSPAIVKIRANPPDIPKVLKLPRRMCCARFEPSRCHAIREIIVVTHAAFATRRRRARPSRNKFRLSTRKVLMAPRYLHEKRKSPPSSLFRRGFMSRRVVTFVGKSMSKKRRSSVLHDL